MSGMKDCLVVLRDTVALLVGTFGLVHSQVTGMVSIPLIVVYATALGIPGIISLLELRKTTPTTPPPSQAGDTDGKKQ